MVRTRTNIAMLIRRVQYTFAFAYTWPKCYKNILREGGGRVPVLQWRLALPGLKEAVASFLARTERSD